MALRKRGHANWARGRSALTHDGIKRGADSRRGKPRGHYRTTARAREVFDPITYLNGRTQSYVYLLGLYLGDGSIVSSSNKLEICLDARYPVIVERCVAAMKAVHPRRMATIRRKGESCRVVYSYAWQWEPLFLQHGPG